MPPAVDLFTPDGLILWLVRSLSLFNAMALLWLGLTVLLNVEHRRPGNLLAGAGLLLGGLFFTVHSIVVGLDPANARNDVQGWWPLAWWVLIGLPYLWYLMVAWYTNLTRSWRTALCTVTFGVLAVMLLGAPPLDYEQLAEPRAVTALARVGLPLALAYAFYSLLCFALSLTALRAPVVSDRFLGDVARSRARPWLVAATLVLVLASISVAGLTVWFVSGIAAGQLSLASSGVWATLMAADALVSAEVGLTTLLLGRAMASYEVFTGRTLPRQGLLRHWRRTIAVAAGYSATIATALALPVPPSYGLVLSAVVMSALLALLSWRLFVERERGIAQLRAFAGGERGSGWSNPTTGGPDPQLAALTALANDVLGASAVLLQPLGSLAPLVSAPLAHPAGKVTPSLDTAAWTPDLTCVPLPTAASPEYRWVVPLWSGRGLAGALLLGDKLDGGLYTQEEMEVARAAGERLLDELASAELTRRLLILERQRLAESQVLDQRTRRVLHDEVLPLVQTVMLRLDAAERANPGVTGDSTALLGDAHRQIASLLRELPSPFSMEVAKLGVIVALQRAVTDELAAAFSAITWLVEVAEAPSRALPVLAAEVVFTAAREAARNAARHGRGGDTGRDLQLVVEASWSDGLELTIADDGVGLPAPGDVTAGEASGHGLTLHSAMVAVVGGTLTTERDPAGGTRVRISMPVEGAPTSRTL